MAAKVRSSGRAIIFTPSLSQPMMKARLLNSAALSTCTAAGSPVTGQSWSISRSLSHAVLSKTEFSRHRPTDKDMAINPLGVKGIGEIGIVGTSAALANAIYHATGQRLRDLPLRIDSLITGV